MTSPVFNRRRPYGTITPPYNGALFEQDGHCFDSAGGYLFSHDAALVSREPQQVASNSHFGATSLPAPAPVSAPGVNPDLLDALATMSATDQKALLKALGGVVQPQTETFEASGTFEQAPATTTVTVEGAGSVEPPEQPGQPNLVAWAKGEMAYPFFQISKHVKAVHPGIVTTNTKTIIEGLISAGVVRAEDAKRV